LPNSAHMSVSSLYQFLVLTGNFLADSVLLQTMVSMSASASVCGCWRGGTSHCMWRRSWLATVRTKRNAL
jgi:hypothetical protein